MFQSAELLLETGRLAKSALGAEAADLLVIFLISWKLEQLANEVHRDP
jgi:hypothetical protein